MMDIYTVEEIVDLGNQVLGVFDSLDKAQVFFAAKEAARKIERDEWARKNFIDMERDGWKYKPAFELHKYQIQ